MNKWPCNYFNAPIKIRNLVDNVVLIFEKNLLDNLIGVYLHGSLAMNAFNPYISDLDFLIVINEELSADKKYQIIKEIIQLSDTKIPPKKGLEFSVVIKKFLEPFVYPTPFELHYSPYWKEKYRNNEVDLTKKKNDKDLAAHFMVTYFRGICLYGIDIKEIMQEIPRDYYIDSLLYDTNDLVEVIHKDSIYAILNYCRVLYYLKTGKVASKIEGGNWALNTINEKYHKIIKKALKSYEMNDPDLNFLERELTKFANYMKELIENSI